MPINGNVYHDQATLMYIQHSALYGGEHLRSILGITNTSSCGEQKASVWSVPATSQLERGHWLLP